MDARWQLERTGASVSASSLSSAAASLHLTLSVTVTCYCTCSLSSSLHCASCSFERQATIVDRWLIDPQAQNTAALRPSVSRCSTLRAIRAVPIDSKTFHGGVCLGPRSSLYTAGVCRAEFARSRLDALACSKQLARLSLSSLSSCSALLSPRKQSNPRKMPNPVGAGPVHSILHALPLPSLPLNIERWIPGSTPISTTKDVALAVSVYLAIIFGGQDFMANRPAYRECALPQSRLSLFFPRPNRTRLGQRRRVGVRAAPRCAGQLAHPAHEAAC